MSNLITFVLGILYYILAEIMCILQLASLQLFNCKQKTFCFAVAKSTKRREKDFRIRYKMKII